VVSAQRRHVALDGDCVRQVPADAGRDEFPRIVLYRAELGRNPVKRRCHAVGPAFAQASGGEERDRIGVRPQRVVWGRVPVVKGDLRVDEAGQKS
jgi:hypothetical protein